MAFYFEKITYVLTVLIVGFLPFAVVAYHLLLGSVNGL